MLIACGAPVKAWGAQRGEAVVRVNGYRWQVQDKRRVGCVVIIGEHSRFRHTENSRVRYDQTTEYRNI